MMQIFCFDFREFLFGKKIYIRVCEKCNLLSFYPYKYRGGSEDECKKVPIHYCLLF